METSNIPRFFWIALSFCMVVATLGLLGIAWQSTSVSFEIADAKITMSSALADVKEIKSDLEIENKRLIEEKESLENLLSELKETTENSPDNPEKILESFFTGKTSSTPTTEIEKRLHDVTSKIDAIEKTIRKK
jgi:septal ring factor EnvC (AmiA/AmiB activator)